MWMSGNKAKKILGLKRQNVKEKWTEFYETIIDATQK
jgi:ribosomal protein L24E